MSDIVLIRAVLELRHNKEIPLSEYMPKLNTIIKVNKKEFPQNSMDIDNNALILGNPQQGYQCVIDPNRIAIDFDTPSSIEPFRNICMSAVKSITDELDLSVFSRIGLRVWLGILQKDFGQANKIIKNRFLKISEDDLDLLGQNHENFKFSVSSTVGKYKATYNFVSATFQDIQIGNNISKANVSKFYTLMDIDYYIDKDTNVEELSDFFHDVDGEIINKSSVFSRIIKGES